MLGSKLARHRLTASTAGALLFFASWAPAAAARSSEGTAVSARETSRTDAPTPQRTSGPPKVVAALTQLKTWVGGRKGQLTAHVLDLEDHSTWAQANEDLALNPASNMKLVTAAVALSELGASYAFRTGLYGELEGGRIERLALRGHGDPSLTTSDIWRLARALQRLGVEQVGDVLVDQTRFDDQFVPPAFEQQPNEWASFRAPVSAVAIDGNHVTLHVRPTTAGKPARTWFEPPGIVELEGSVQTRKSGSGQSVRFDLAPLPTAGSKTPANDANSSPRSADATTTPSTASGKLTARLGGYVSEKMPRLKLAKRLDDPRTAPGRALSTALRSVGVRVDGRVALGGADITGRLVFHRSEPLSKLIHALGKRSDNFYAEMLLKNLGAEAGKRPARSRDGAAVALEWLERIGARHDETRVENGSGLFDANRLSARSFTTLLAHVADDPKLAPEFLAHLSIGGVDGTLRSRLRASSTQHRVRAKTGTLARAISLSGYAMRAEGGRPVAFSFLVNGISGQARATRTRIDRVVSAIVAAARQR